MKIYIVGGAVRDRLLGLPVQDRDYVVVGATPEEMVAKGFRPVGKDFPVFLHPSTHEEYALARTERKTAPGYKGFVFHTDPAVTLEEDLRRRDLTINAMAQAQDGSIIDPFGGQKDVQDKIFRHVSPAFAEDPVRILRVARFAARFAEFTVAPETVALMRQIVDAGEVDMLVPERVWQELARGLMEVKPSRMFEVLHACGALAHILPELDDAGIHAMRAVDYAAQRAYSLPVRLAALMRDLNLEACRRLRIPNECRAMVVMTEREHVNVVRALELSAEAMAGLFERCDAFRKPRRFIEMLHASECKHFGCTGSADSSAGFAYPQISYLEDMLHAAQSVDAGAIANDVMQRYPDQPKKIPDAIRNARIAIVARKRSKII